MRAARLALCAMALLGTLLATSAAAAPPGAPKGLRGFELRPNETQTHTFSRTPAFAWNPSAVLPATSSSSRRVGRSTEAPSSGRTSRAVSGPARRARPSRSPHPQPTTQRRRRGLGYRGQDANRPDPDPGDIREPRAALVHRKPYALWAHVRAVTTRGATSWSTPFGFNVRWESTPVPQPAKPGLVRWAPVEGATAYDVWYPDIRKVIRTHTNVADQRELYTFHLEDSWWQLVRWRVRPVRQVVGALPNGLPAVSYGPWSPTYATTNPAWAGGKLQVRAAISDEVSTESKAAAHQLMPAMTFGGDTGTDGRQYRLFRAYAFTDRDCVNAVFRGSVVGGPAYAPASPGLSSSRRTRKSSTSRWPASSRARSRRPRRRTWPTEPR